MWVNGLRKCFVTILIIMCPNKSFKNSISAFPDKSEVTIEPALNPYLSVPTKWIIDVIKRDKDTGVNMLHVDEPGFDFDDKEMNKFKIWKNGIIPFYIDDFSFDKVLRDMIRDFLDAVNDVTGLRFVELTRPPEDEKTRWVFFVNRRGLLNVNDHPIKEFTNTGVQKVVLGYNSMCTRGELPKAVLALVGVPPQHTAPNRDEFVVIVPGNIQPDKVKLFDKLKDDEWLFHDVPYDYASASHYHFHQYTMNGFATLQPHRSIKPLPTAVGEGNGFSHSDILKIRMLYNYISKEMSDKEKISNCAKLFKTGPNLTQIDSKQKLISRPREKPDKYLGLPEKVADDNKNEDSETDEVNEKSKIKKDNESGNDQANDCDETNTTVNRKGKLSVNAKEPLKKRKRTTRNKLIYGHVSNEIFKDISDYKSA